MFKREELRQLGASMIAELGHIPSTPKVRRVARRKKGVPLPTAVGEGKAVHDLSASTAADWSEVQDSTMASDKDHGGLWPPRAHPQPQWPQPTEVPSPCGPSRAWPAGEPCMPRECELPAPKARQDFEGILAPQRQPRWAPNTPTWVLAHKTDALPLPSASLGPHNPTAAMPMYVNIPSLDNVHDSCLYWL